MNSLSTDAQVECMAQPFLGSANVVSADLFQNVTLHLLAFFRAQGCVLPIRQRTDTLTQNHLAQAPPRFGLYPPAIA